MSDERQEEIVARFTALYYDLPLRGETGAWLATSWLGVPVLKAPTDLWAYQEILSEIRPDLIVETGTAAGGSALFLASICDQLGHGRVLTVDIDDRPVLELAYNRPVARPMHPRIRYLHGSSIAPEIVAEVRREATGAAGVLVILDSDHRREHVLAEMRLYAPLVTPGSYLIVEDTIVNGHPVLPDFGPGPLEAVEAFLRERDDFAVDRTREKYLLTFNVGGYLQRL